MKGSPLTFFFSISSVKKTRTTRITSTTDEKCSNAEFVDLYGDKLYDLTLSCAQRYNLDNYIFHLVYAFVYNDCLQENLDEQQSKCKKAAADWFFDCFKTDSYSLNFKAVDILDFNKLKSNYSTDAWIKMLVGFNLKVKSNLVSIIDFPMGKLEIKRTNDNWYADYNDASAYDGIIKIYSALFAKIFKQEVESMEDILKILKCKKKPMPSCLRASDYEKVTQFLSCLPAEDAPSDSENNVFNSIAIRSTQSF